MRRNTSLSTSRTETRGSAPTLWQSLGSSTPYLAKRSSIVARLPLHKQYISEVQETCAVKRLCWVCWRWGPIIYNLSSVIEVDIMHSLHILCSRVAFCYSAEMDILFLRVSWMERNISKGVGARSGNTKSSSGYCNVWAFSVSRPISSSFWVYLFYCFLIMFAR